MSLGQATATKRAFEGRQGSPDDPTEWCLLPPDKTTTVYSLQVGASIGDVETLRPIWRKWAYSLDNDIDNYLYIITHDPAVLRPYVVTVYADGIARAMLIGQVRQQRASSVVSFVNISGPNVKVLQIKKGGRMGGPSPTIDRLLALELLKATNSGEV